MGYFEDFIGVNFWTALFVLLNTLTIFFVARKFLFNPVMKIINDRQQEIDDLYTDADRNKEAAASLRAEYEEKLSEAKKTGEAIVRDAMARGQAREEEILRQANREADAIRQKAEADIAQEKKKALNEAKNEISDIAMTIAGKVVGRQLDDNDQARLVDEFIDGLGDGV